MNSKINKKVQVSCSNSRQTEVKSYRWIMIPLLIIAREKSLFLLQVK